MRKALRLLLPLLFVIGYLFAFAVPVGAETQQYDSYTAGDDAAVDLYGSNWYAQTFTTGEAYSVTSVHLKFYRVGEPGIVTVSIRAVDDVGNPTGRDLVSGTLNANTITTATGGAWYQIEFSSEYALEADETYAILVRAIAGDSANYLCWRYDSSGSYTDGSYTASLDSGLTWATAANDFMFSTWGNPVLVILGAKVFTGYLEEGDWLIVVVYGNEYPPYYGTESPTQYFDLQLVEETLGTSEVLAQVKLAQWGFKPGSIYLSKAMADQLVWGGNGTYEVRMEGRFGDNPSVSYALVSAAWSGSELKVLDDQVLNTAEAMAIYYDTPMTTYVDGNIKVLNSVGGTFFATGIPRLGHVRPHLFEYPPLDVYHEPTEWTRDYEESFVWRDILGPDVEQDATTIGFVFGLTALQSLQMLFFGTWVSLSVVVAAIAGSAALLVSIPFLIIGIVTGILPIAPFAIVASLLVLVAIWIFWFRGT